MSSQSGIHSIQKWGVPSWGWGVEGHCSPGCMILGFAPKYARFTLAFLPSMMGLGSLQALSAAARSAMVTLATYTHRHTHKALNQPLKKPTIALEKSFVLIKLRGGGVLNFFFFGGGGLELIP